MSLRLLLAALVVLAAPALAQDRPPLGLMDVFELEYASDPQISPDGETIVYRRNRLDVRTDRVRGDLWQVSSDGSGHRPLVVGVDASGARWSPDGTRIAYLAQDTDEMRRHLMIHYVESGVAAPVARLASAPSGIAWSPDGTQIAFTRFVETSEAPLARLPGPPEGATWADAPIEVERTNWRSDGSGYVRPGARQLFVVSAEGGTPRPLTSGEHSVDGTPAWTPEADALIVSSDRREGAELDPGDTELYRVDLASGAMTALTDRVGADRTPAVSARGTIAYLGTDDRRLGYQVTNLYVRDGTDSEQILPALDRDVRSPTWIGDEEIAFSYDDAGTTRLAKVNDRGQMDILASDVGGMSIGRPYPGGSFSIGGGMAAFTLVGTQHPADVAVVSLDGGEVRRLTHLNDDLFSQRALGEVEEFTYTSSADGLEIEGWIVTPPGFDPSQQYPLILEIHGGPFQNYGPRFS
ncbi:MAG: DPP IV N-terminal domain-containing protein, partial [Bacteroidota bacterium]